MLSEDSEYISHEKAKDGFKKCHLIVHRLLTDADLLFKNGRYSSSIALAILAFEEVSKAQNMYLKIKEGGGLKNEEWQGMSFGSQAHKKKLRSLVEFTESKLNVYDEEHENAINIFHEKLGISTKVDLKSQKEQVKILKKVVPNLNFVKQECFYLNWDEKNGKWTYFDMRFDEKVKKAVAYFLILETKRLLMVQKFVMENPNKPYNQYSDEEFEKVANSNRRKELQAILDEINTLKFKQIRDLALSVIENYKM